ncbi:MAG: sugar transferase [Roseburia sp.]|nr:sugar transferase [Roseburia sp.]
MYRSNVRGWLKHLDFMIIDIICLHVSFFMAYVIRHGWQNPYRNFLYRDSALFITFADICVMFLFNIYKNVLKRGCYREFKTTVKQIIFVELFASMYLFSTQSGGAYSRAVLFMLCPVYVVVSYVVRLLWKRLLGRMIKNNKVKRLFVVTDADYADTVVNRILNSSPPVFTVTGIAITDQFMVGQNIKGIPVVASLDTAARYIGSEWIDEVLIVYEEGESCCETLYEDILKTGVTVHYKIAELHDVCGRSEMIERIGGYTVLTTARKCISLKQAAYKRALDIAGGLVGSLFTLLLILVLGPAIYISSPGPIFFSQIRIGRNGKRFRMYKFRSMYPDAEKRKAELIEQNESGDGLMFKMDFDPRVIGNRILPDGTRKTGIGDFIRRTSLDEFPQFFNVLKGDMSLVGTRPPTVDEWEKYELHHRARLAGKPGITGMWQISGRSNIMDFEEVVKLDTMYINDWNFGKDIQILLRTVKTVVMQTGAR